MSDPTTSDNPFAAPISDEPAAGLVSGSLADVRTIATRQKGLLICILVYLLGVLGIVVLGDNPLVFLPIIAGGISMFAGAVFALLLAMKVYGALIGVLLCLLCFVPLLGLLILLMVNQKATGVLKQNGVSVGMLGANMATLPTA